MELEQIKEELKKSAPDFAKKIAPIYTLLQWEWLMGETTPYIPDAPKIEKALLSLIEALTDECHGCGTGGLYVYYELPDEETKERGEYGLSFRLEEIHSF